MFAKATALLAASLLLLPANAAMLRALEEEKEIKPLVVTGDREIVPQTGLPPEGRVVLASADHPLPDPMAKKLELEGDGGDRRLAIACGDCFWSSYYGYIFICCDHTGTCVYYYC